MTMTFKNTDETDFKSFIKHHYKKILIGGGVGGVTGTFIALFEGLSPLQFGLLVTFTTLFGAGAGVGMGVFEDRCFYPETNDALNETKSLLKGLSEDDYNSEEKELISTPPTIPIGEIVILEETVKETTQTSSSSSNWHFPSVSLANLSFLRRFMPASQQKDNVQLERDYQLKNG